MLTLRILQLLLVGLCLFLIAKYLQFVVAMARGLDRLMRRRFFDIDGLTRDIRRQWLAQAQAGRAVPELKYYPIYRWLYTRLRRLIQARRRMG